VAQTRLAESELAAIEKMPPLTRGMSYMFVMTYGWAIVCYYVDRPEPLMVRVAHANHFHNSHSDYGKMSQDGAVPECEWRYEGTSVLMYTQIHHFDEYHGEVPRGRKSGDAP
jgi:hypothetical protein